MTAPAAVGTVYLVAQPSISRNKPPFNLAPLYEHGEVRVLVENGEHPSYHPGKVLGLIRQRLRDFNPETDKIAWAGGDTLSAILVGAVLADLSATAPEGQEWSEFTWLRYDRPLDEHNRRTEQGARYLPIRVSLANSDLEEPR